MVRVGAKLFSLVLLVSWLAPAALATYVSPVQSCCRRGGHHCLTSPEPSFRSAKLHCHSCQAVLTAHQAPRPASFSTGFSPRDEHPFAHEFSSAFAVQGSHRQRSERAPPIFRLPLTVR